VLSVGGFGSSGSPEWTQLQGIIPEDVGSPLGEFQCIGAEVRDDVGEVELNQGTWRTGVRSDYIITVRNVPRSAEVPQPVSQ
jgi:hypothetical protein